MPQLVVVISVLVALIGVGFGAGVKYAALSSKGAERVQQVAPVDS